MAKSEEYSQEKLLNTASIKAKRKFVSEIATALKQSKR